jgi:hypothetical protein
MAEESITPAARFYRLHRDEQLARKKEEYNNRPEVIAKREERRRKMAEREAERKAKQEEEKAEKQQEKDKKIQELVAIAVQTKRKIKKISEHNLTEFLAESSPAL